MKIEVAFNNNFHSIQKDFGLNKCVCAVIDVIRATTTIATILAKGAEEILIAKNKTEAFLFKKMYKRYILCGEEGGHPPKGFDYGNSPLEFSKMKFSGLGVILKTTNGTKSFFKTTEAAASFSLSLVNLKSVMEKILKKAQESQSDILFISSGEKGKTSYDDFYVAGLATKYLLTKGLKLELSDNAKIAISACLGQQSHYEALRKSISANTLIKAGLSPDLEFCAKENLYQIAPILKKKQHPKEMEDRFAHRPVYMLKADQD
jgi:2-phosphosulfolactate phosphatase